MFQFILPAQLSCSNLNLVFNQLKFSPLWNETSHAHDDEHGFYAIVPAHKQFPAAIVLFDKDRHATAVLVSKPVDGMWILEAVNDERLVQAAVFVFRTTAEWLRIEDFEIGDLEGLVRGIQFVPVADENGFPVFADQAPSFGPFELLNSGANPEGLMVQANCSGDLGIYQEAYVTVTKDGEAVADVRVGIDESGQPLITMTADGYGDGDHKICIHPMRSVDTAIEVLKEDSHVYAL